MCVHVALPASLPACLPSYLPGYLCVCCLPAHRGYIVCCLSARRGYLCAMRVVCLRTLATTSVPCALSVCAPWLLPLCHACCLSAYLLCGGAHAADEAGDGLVGEHIEEAVRADDEILDVGRHLVSK